MRFLPLPSVDMKRPYSVRGMRLPFRFGASARLPFGRRDLLPLVGMTCSLWSACASFRFGASARLPFGRHVVGILSLWSTYAPSGRHTLPLVGMTCSLPLRHDLLRRFRALTLPLRHETPLLRKGHAVGMTCSLWLA